MKKIAFILPYFGKLPINFDLWLKSCEYNKEIDFIVFTDDEKSYAYPSNVHVIYTSFEAMKEKIQNFFNFKILIDRPWRLSLFKPAYGLIFKDELKDYDFWGYCDADLMWGNIKAFVTDELLEKYERIGTKGHASLYKNTDDVNSRFMNIVSETANYKKIFCGLLEYSFDENGMDEIYDYLNIPYYFAPNYAHLEKFESSFYLKRLGDKLYTNKYQVFEWNEGKLLRKYIDREELYDQEYMYIHFYCRPMKYLYGGNECTRYIMYPDKVKPYSGIIDVKYVKKHGHQSKSVFYIKMIWYNRRKFTLKKIKNNLKNLLIYKRK